MAIINLKKNDKESYATADLRDEALSIVDNAMQDRDNNLSPKTGSIDMGWVALVKLQVETRLRLAGVIVEEKKVDIEI